MKSIVVYRVAPYIRHDDEPETTPKYRVEARDAKAGKMIALARPFTDLSKTCYSQKALGRIFFETPLQAIVNFAANQRLAIESADRARREAERALFWAYTQGAPVPKEPM
jgi:hypothetical protein